MFHILDKYLNFKYYGYLSKFPLSAVSISEDYLSIKKELLKNKDDFSKSILYRRIGLFDLSLYYAKRALKKNINEIKILNLVICHYDNLNLTEAKELLLKLQSNNPSFYLYRNYIFNSHVNPYRSNEKLIFLNPLLFFNLNKFKKINLNIQKIYLRLFNEDNALPFLILIKSNSLLIINDQDKNKILSLVSKYKKEISLDEIAIRKLKEKFKAKIIIKALTQNNKLILTCEIIENLLSELPNFTSLFKKNLIKKYQLNSNLLSKNEMDKIIKLILSEPYLLKDKNTSNYGTRYHSLDLSESKNKYFLKLKKIFNVYLTNYFNKEMKKIIEFDNFKVRYNKSPKIWFDASLSYGESKINSHLHTNSYNKLNLCTMVLYLKVPSLKKNEGNLMIHFNNNKKITFIPKNYNILIFPSWFKHETTPVLKNEIRLTFNADLFFNKVELIYK